MSMIVLACIRQVLFLLRSSTDVYRLWFKLRYLKISWENKKHHTKCILSHVFT